MAKRIFRIEKTNAVYMNLMQTNLSVTYGLYGSLSTADVGKRIAGLGKIVAKSQISQEELANQLITIGSN